MKKALPIFLTAVLTASFLTACGESGTPGESEAAAAQATAEAESGAFDETAASDEAATEGTADGATDGIVSETVPAASLETVQEAFQPDMSDPFTEFVYAPYQSEHAFEDINSAEAADTYRLSQGVENEGTQTLEGGVELYFTDTDSWDLETGESYDSMYLEFRGTVDGSQIYTYYSYSDTELDSVVTDFGTVKDASGGLAPVGGFADYAQKYNCFTIADFFKAFGMEEEGLMTALEENAVLYETSFDTELGTVEVTLDDYTINGVKNREAAIDFPDGSPSPWKKILLSEYEDSMSVHGWTEFYRWLY